MNKRIIIVLSIIVVSAVIIGFIIYLLVFYNFTNKKKTQSNTPAPQTSNLPTVSNVKQPAGSATAETPVASGVPISGDKLVQTDATQIAKTFVERYGTYSNQGGSSQFDDLKFFSTAKMQAWLKTDLATSLAAKSDFHSSFVVTTKAVSADIIDIDAAKTKATVLVGTQRREVADGQADKNYTKSIKLEMIRSGQRWLVDTVTWQ